MKIVQLAGGPVSCLGSQSCPTIYRIEGTDRVIVKGNKLSPMLRAELNPEDHEDVVELPESVVRSALSAVHD